MNRKSKKKERLVAGARRVGRAAAALLLGGVAAAQCGPVAAGGSVGSAATGGYTMGYSLGQVVASAAAAEGIRLGEGLQQGFTIEVERIGGVEGTPQVEIFPNPTAGQLVLRRGEGHAETSVELYSADGRRIESRPWQGAELRLDLSALPAGQYMLHIEAAAYKVIKR